VEQGNTALKPILDYYEDKGILVKVDGTLDIGEVEKKVQEVLEK